MKLRIFIGMILVGLTGCSHPRPQAADSRSALLRPLATSGSEDPKNTTRSDGKIHGAVSVGTGFGGRGNYGLVPRSGPGGMTGTGISGTDMNGLGAAPGSW